MSSVTHVPLCTVPGCPAPNNPDWHVPFCGHGLAGEHHHVPKRSQGGKRICAFLCPDCHAKTDTKYDDKAYYDHNQRLVYMLWKKNNDGTPGRTLIHRFVDSGEVVGEGQGSARSLQARVDRPDRPASLPLSAHPQGMDLLEEAPPEIVSGDAELQAVADKARYEKRYGPTPRGATRVNPPETPQDAILGGPGTEPVATAILPQIVSSSHGPDVSYEAMTDEELAVLYQQADKLQADAFVRKCCIVAEFRRRHEQHWGESWVQKPLELLPEAPSKRVLQAWANLGEIFADSAQIQEHAGKLSDSRSLMEYIGRKALPDGREAMAAAIQQIEQYGEVPTVAKLAQILGEEAKPECDHVLEEVTILRCMKCGVMR